MSTEEKNVCVHCGAVITRHADNTYHCDRQGLSQYCHVDEAQGGTQLHQPRLAHNPTDTKEEPT